MGINRTINMIKNTSNWMQYLLYKLGGKKNPTFTYHLRNNFRVTVPRVIQPEFKELFFEEIYVKHLPKELISIDGPVVIDIGANVGFFSIFSLFKFMNPRVISFEPIKRNFKLLHENIKLANQSKLTVINKAVNDTIGELVLKFNSSQDITTSASLFDNQYGSDEETVYTTTLEATMQEFSLSKIDLLKLDCEGAEYNIIYNTPRTFFDKVNCMSMETHIGKAGNENNASLLDYIKGLGFTTITERNSFIWAYKEPSVWK